MSFKEIMTQIEKTNPDLGAVEVVLLPDHLEIDPNSYEDVRKKLKLHSPQLWKTIKDKLKSEPNFIRLGNSKVANYIVSSSHGWVGKRLPIKFDTIRYFSTGAPLVTPLLLDKSDELDGDKYVLFINDSRRSLFITKGRTLVPSHLIDGSYSNLNELLFDFVGPGRRRRRKKDTRTLGTDSEKFKASEEVKFEGRKKLIKSLFTKLSDILRGENQLILVCSSRYLPHVRSEVRRLKGAKKEPLVIGKNIHNTVEQNLIEELAQTIFDNPKESTDSLLVASDESQSGLVLNQTLQDKNSYDLNMSYDFVIKSLSKSTLPNVFLEINSWVVRNSKYLLNVKFESQSKKFLTLTASASSIRKNGVLHHIEPPHSKINHLHPTKVVSGSLLKNISEGV